MLFLKHLVLLFTFIYGVIECRQFRFDYTEYPGIGGQLKFHIIPAKWEDARTMCDLEGGILASPINDNMKQALDSEMAKKEAPRGIFTGVNSISSKGYFFAIEGEPLDNMPLEWLPGEPNNLDNEENCISYGNGKVADVKCSDLLPFMCYKKGTGKSNQKCSTGNSTGQPCYWYHNQLTTWNAAQRTCVAEGGHLAVINSEQEAEAIKNFLSSQEIAEDINSVFIGFRDMTERGNWKTIFGQTLEETGYAEWLKEPPAVTFAHCGAVDVDSGKLVNYWCSDGRALAPSLCEGA